MSPHDILLILLCTVIPLADRLVNAPWDQPVPAPYYPPGTDPTNE